MKPLTKINAKSTLLQQYIPYLQQVAFPISTCFLYAIHKNNILRDITNNPYTTAFIIYCAIQYNVYAAQEYQKNIKYTELQNSLQEVFYLLIIGHGFRNLIIQQQENSYKMSHALTVNLEILDAFLHKAHEFWASLFLEYKLATNHLPMIMYHSDDIQLFNILQAASHDQILMNMIIHYYQKINTTCNNAQAILEYLEQKFILLHDKSLLITTQKKVN